MRSSIYILCFSVMIMISLIPSHVMAETDSGSDIIKKDYFKAHSISFYQGESITIKFSMELTFGPNIDVFVVNDENYRKMSKDNHFEYYSNNSKLNTTRFNDTMIFTDHDTYYIVFDNTHYETYPSASLIQDTAFVDWTLEWDIVSEESSNGCSSIMLIPFSLLMLSLISLIYFLRK